MLANVLLVEDEKSITTLIKYNLEKEGFKVYCSETGEDALKVIKEKIPDIVILDWMLPDTSGIDVCRHIKIDKKLKNIPVLILTAKGEPDDKIKGLEVGADDYVTKPFNNKELLLSKLLDFFIKSPQRVYSREQLLNNVWGENINVESRTVDVHIRRLRKAINLDNKVDLIRTVRSSGYSLDV
ncbi:MAG: response regulator [Candidatus Fonsibacter ubiquis]|nr:response regulator [Candidatus Fonsibacter ubiquis]